MIDLNAWSNRQMYANEQNHKPNELNEEVDKFWGMTVSPI